MLRDRVFVGFVAVFFLLLVVFQQANVAQPMAMARDGLTAAQVGYMGAINGVLIVALQLPPIRWLERLPVPGVIAASGLVLGTGMAVPLFGSSVGIFAISVTVWTIGEIGCTPISSAVVARLAPAHLRSRNAGNDDSRPATRTGGVPGLSARRESISTTVPATTTMQLRTVGARRRPTRQTNPLQAHRSALGAQRGRQRSRPRSRECVP